jgi:hypothetical protein
MPESLSTCRRVAKPHANKMRAKQLGEQQKRRPGPYLTDERADTEGYGFDRKTRDTQQNLSAV